MAPIQTDARNATLQDVFPMLQHLHSIKLDAVVPAQAMRSVNGVLHVEGLRVFDTAAVRPTALMDGHIATRLGIPVKYLRWMRENRLDLYDANINGLIHGGVALGGDVVAAPSTDAYLLRTFSDPEGGEGVGRALLSDHYAPIEHIDVLMAALEGVHASGVHCEVVSANLTETRMSVRFAAPGVAALAPVLLGHYRPPTDDGIAEWVPAQSDAIVRLREAYGTGHLGYEPGTEPVVFAGFDVDNSETGGGAFMVRPVITVKACKNGLKLDLAQSLRKVHLGGKLEEGAIRWSDDTRRKSVELVKAQTKDAVEAFISPEFLQNAVDGIEAKAGAKVTDAVKLVEHVAKTLSYTDDEQAGILAHFISGGQMTSGGILNAITSYAQTVESADEAYDLETSAMQALEVAYAAA